MPTAAPSPLLRGLMLFALYAVPLVVTLRPVGAPNSDPDIWWHLAVGRWVADHGTVPDLDPFTQLHRPWVAYSWLYEILVYQLHQSFGLVGVVAYRVVLSLAIVASLHALVAFRQPRFLPAVALTGAAVLATAGLFSERPWLCTVLFSTWTLHAVLTVQQTGRVPRVVWLLPLVYVLWANIHVQFVYGLFVLGLACVAPCHDRLPSATWRQLIALTALCTVATLVNPYHVRLYGVVLEYATQPGPFTYVPELGAMKFREIGDWIALALLASACFVLGRRSRIDVFEVLLLAAAAWFAFRALRDVWLLVMACLVVLARSSSEPVPDEERFPLTPIRVLLLLVALGGLAAGVAWRRDLSPEHLGETVASVFPVEAARVVRDKRYPGPLFNDFNWGGYLIWALPSDDYPVALDGRTNLHGDERILRYGAVWAGQPGWRDDPDLSAAGVVIAAADAPLASLLLLDERFKQVYKDDVARVFVRGVK